MLHVAIKIYAKLQSVENKETSTYRFFMSF
jgi:hypothetical protein